MGSGLGLGAALLAASCNQIDEGGNPGSSEDLGQTESPIFTNADFESGLPGAPPSNWTVETFINNGITVQTPQTRAGLNLAAGGRALTTNFFSSLGPLSVADVDLGTGASLRWPRFGNQCAMVNYHSSKDFGPGVNGNAQNVNGLTQTMTLGPNDIDPADSQVHIRFAVAPVLQNPAHPANQQPYYMVQLTDITQANALLYSDFNLSGATGIPWKKVNGGMANEIDYTDWQLVDISPSNAKFAMGDSVKLEVLAGGCSPGGHFGEVYVDGGPGPTVPGLFVSASGPSQANACNNITYDLLYENGSSNDETAVKITFNTPPQTTFVSDSPVAPVTCTDPGVGNSGQVICTVGNLAKGASGHVKVTVNIGCAATGTVTAGDYWVESKQETPLLGPHVNTLIGCTLDSQCASGNWCDETDKKCTPELPNGQPIPSDPPHTNPKLNKTCTADAAKLVCLSAVCDTKDNDCGYLSGDGPCDATNGTKVCRDGACSPNAKVCIPVGGCAVDSDCTSAQWCDTSKFQCTPKLPNSTPIPNVGGHTPPLDGKCTNDNGKVVCISGVCDNHDNECGYLTGDGFCTLADPYVCRSGACSTNGLCEPSGGCLVDTDCTSGNWCIESQEKCTPQSDNGQPVPSDSGHKTPILDGSCTDAAAQLTCKSGVCDTKDKDCGYADGDGPCDAADGATVCRSGVCSTIGKCQPVNGCLADKDCTAGNWCEESTQKCTPQLGNNESIPSDPGHREAPIDSKCTTGAGTIVCKSGVCDTKDDKCGFANGDGTCDDKDGGTVCRSTVCATDGPNAGVCEACAGDTMCKDDAPICDSATSTCVPCDRDNGATGGEPCPSPDAPTCHLTGSDKGSCFKCTEDDDCVGHEAGPSCDTTTGACGPATGCKTDADCSGDKWCDADTGSTGDCQPKIPNGKPLPKSPSSVTTCTTDVGARVCISGACDPKDNECGFDKGDGPCGESDECRVGDCETSTMTCEVMTGCTKDADCDANQFCDTSSKKCTAKLPNGTACAGSNQCVSNSCDESKVCDAGFFPQGGACSVDLGSEDGAFAGLFGLAALGAAIAGRRRGMAASQR